MTFAPRSPSIIVQSGPARTRVRSSTRISLSIVLLDGVSIVTRSTDGPRPRIATSCGGGLPAWARLRSCRGLLYFRHDEAAFWRAKNSAAIRLCKSSGILPADFDGPMADKPFPSSSQHSPLPSALNASPAESGGPTSGNTGSGGSGQRSLGHRTSDVRDAMAEMAGRAQQISQEAGTKITAAMKDVIGAAAGLAGFAVESARDLVQYMVRRGQMTQDEADKLIQEAEAAFAKRAKPPKPAASPVAAPRKAAPPTPTAKAPVKPAAKSA